MIAVAKQQKKIVSTRYCFNCKIQYTASILNDTFGSALQPEKLKEGMEKTLPKLENAAVNTLYRREQYLCRFLHTFISLFCTVFCRLFFNFGSSSPSLPPDVSRRFVFRFILGSILTFAQWRFDWFWAFTFTAADKRCIFSSQSSLHA